MDPVPRLACQQCRRRKIRCDKQQPCSACQTAHLECDAIQRARLPRGRSGNSRGKRKELLEDRVARIENLLQHRPDASDASDRHSGPAQRTTSPGPPGGHGVAGGTPGSGREGGSRRSPRLGDRIDDFIAPDFWASLSDEIQGLREALETGEDQEEDVDVEVKLEPYPGATETCNMGAMMFRRSGYEVSRAKLPVPTESFRNVLFRLYRQRVDFVYKIGHWPTMLAEVKAIDPSRPWASPSAQALEYSIYFMALCTIDDKEAADILMASRQDVIDMYRAAAEALIAHSKLLQNPDLTSLQAFVIYLIGLRTQENSTLNWTLLAIATRVASGLRLGDERPGEFSAFELEIRRRLISIIGMLDTLSSVDRASTPLMPASSFSQQLLEVDDCDMSPEYTPSTPSETFTDMTFAAMLQCTTRTQHRIFEICRSTRDGWTDWNKKLEIIQEMHDFTKQRNDLIEDSSPPLQRFYKLCSRQMELYLAFTLRRPHYQGQCDVVPPWDSFDTMSAATEVLEAHMLTWRLPEFKVWSWRFITPWTPLAIVLAELCQYPFGPAADRAYEIAVECFREAAPGVADSEKGMLWRPMARLMRRVNQIRHGIATIPENSPDGEENAGRSQSVTEKLQSQADDWGHMHDALSVIMAGSQGLSTDQPPRPALDGRYLNWNLFHMDDNLSSEQNYPSPEASRKARDN